MPRSQSRPGEGKVLSELSSMQPDPDRTRGTEGAGTVSPTRHPSLEENEAADKKRRHVKLIVGLVGLVIALVVIGTIFQALALYGDDIPRLLQGLIAVVVGVGGAAALFYFCLLYTSPSPRDGL